MIMFEIFFKHFCFINSQYRVRFKMSNKSGKYKTSVVSNFFSLLNHQHMDLLRDGQYRYFSGEQFVMGDLFHSKKTPWNFNNNERRLALISDKLTLFFIIFRASSVILLLDICSRSTLHLLCLAESCNGVFPP